MLPMDDIRRPNGSVGTQGYTPESMIRLVKHISNVRDLNLPHYTSLKEMILSLRELPEIIDEIVEYVKTDPIIVTKLPDDSYHLNDGNHRANLLNLLYVSEVPAFVK
jgi:ParB-like chromosome segregation protein Spo0J